ncbi:uncharacterized protein LOC133498430 [Syngnathoides biaculeatus]|uniref:uncharacterized protein LOC133498430 n=1 Tax=Syngnathoides biaculeatus TaxID=300417 RepID=UPI002ADDF4D2|nr:uncharacterized protein LOC133498430 [Syngnathoides biaculeatus]
MGRDRTNWPIQDPAGKTRRRPDRRKVDRLPEDQACPIRVGSLTSSTSVSYSPPASTRTSSPGRSKYTNRYEGTRLAIYPGPPRGGQRRRPGRALPGVSRCAATKTQSSHSSPVTVRPADPQLVARLPAQREEVPPNHEAFRRELRAEIERQSAELAALTAQVRQGLAIQPSYVDVAMATDSLVRQAHVSVSTDSPPARVHVAVETDPPPCQVHAIVGTDSSSQVNAAVGTDSPLQVHVAVLAVPSRVHAAVGTDPLPRHAHVSVSTDSPPTQVHVALETDSPPSHAHVAVSTDAVQAQWQCGPTRRRLTLLSRRWRRLHSRFSSVLWSGSGDWSADAPHSCSVGDGHALTFLSRRWRQFPSRLTLPSRRRWSW